MSEGTSYPNTRKADEDKEKQSKIEKSISICEKKTRWYKENFVSLHTILQKGNRQ